MSKSNQELLLMKYVNWNGAIYAFASGSLVGFGYSLLTEYDTELKSDKVWKRLSMRSLGSGMLALGMYLWSPHWVREMWYGEPGRK